MIQIQVSTYHESNFNEKITKLEENIYKLLKKSVNMIKTTSSANSGNEIFTNSGDTILAHLREFMRFRIAAIS